jgi:hypothetical protein
MEILSLKDAKASGSKTYFTGDPCKNGSVKARNVVNRACLCDECSETRKAAAKIHREANKERVAITAKAWHEKQKVLVSLGLKEKKAHDPAKAAASYLANKDRHNAWMAAWYAANKSKVNERRKHRYRTDPEYRCQHMLRSISSRVISEAKSGKKGNTFKVLGYTPADFRIHIEKQFLKGMSWDNHGDWHVDHIVSVSELISSGVTDPAKINALSNLRPLWAPDNLSKGCKQTALL